MIFAVIAAATAASEPAAADYNQTLLQYGAIGAMLVAFFVMSAVGIIFFKPSVDWLKAQIKQQQETNDKLLVGNQAAVPALQEAVSTGRATAEALKDLKGAMDRTREENDRGQREMKEDLRGMREELRSLRELLRDRGGQ